MGYKTILTVVTDEAFLESTIDHAAAVAACWDAHLDVLGFGVDRTQTGYYYAGLLLPAFTLSFLLLHTP